ncbi:MAG: 4-hydroxy-tetrahydrodipicolinate synthase [Puniceicoccales bacterium]|jgi:4-hydroxy-tetrahydrodipicolinate synthase|nr:4-hydroxy-tetrahydrodipicolinate synthase [Puniceicoccales bacterium]
MQVSPKNFRGVYTALVTPFNKGAVDFDSLQNLVDYQLKFGINGLVLLGTTGESVTLDDEERTQVLEFVVKKVDHRIPILVGTGSNCTRKAVQYTCEAAKLGADGMLVVAPYYNRPTQSGLCMHFEKIAASTEKPICLYSIPSRCGIEIGVETIAKLREKYEHIIGVKEAGGSCNRVSQIVKALDKDFCVFCGDDSLTLPFFALGARGVISVASNLAVKPLVKMMDYALSNNLEAAADINRLFYPFFRALTVETNPVPVKQFLYRAGLIASPEVRLPLSPLLETSVDLVNDVFDSLHGKY